MIDLCKITILRAKSKQSDTPQFAFDVATIEREWTLCADSNEDLQVWLQVIASAVDEDVAIVPDDTLNFTVRRVPYVRVLCLWHPFYPLFLSLTYIP